MKKIIVYLMFLLAGIIVSWCSNQSPIEHIDQQNHISWVINFQNWTFERAPFSGERTWDERNDWVTVTTIQNLWNGDFAQIHWLLLKSWTQLNYSGILISKQRTFDYPSLPRHSVTYNELFSWYSGHSFYYSEIGWNAETAISIYALKKNQLSKFILSWLCEQFDVWLESNMKPWIYFWYRPTKSFRETIDYLQQWKSEKADANIIKILEDPKYNISNTMYPCGFPNTFQVIWDYIIAGWFWWKDGWWVRWWWMHSIEIIKKN